MDGRASQAALRSIARSLPFHWGVGAVVRDVSVGQAIAAPGDCLHTSGECFAEEGRVDDPPIQGSPICRLTPEGHVVGGPCGPFERAAFAFVIVRRYAKKWGAFNGKADDRIAAIVAKHSVHTLMSVTRPRRGRFVWQHVPSVSTRHDSGRSSPISMYSFAVIFLMSLGGTEPNPGILVRSPAPAAVSAVAIRGVIRAAELSTPARPGAAIEKTGNAGIGSVTMGETRVNRRASPTDTAGVVARTTAAYTWRPIGDPEHGPGAPGIPVPDEPVASAARAAGVASRCPARNEPEGRRTRLVWLGAEPYLSPKTMFEGTRGRRLPLLSRRMGHSDGLR